MYIFFNNNPQGLKIGDCVVRAISAAMNQPWERTYIDLCIEGFTFRDMPNANNVWDSYLRSKGYNRYIIPNTCPDCYTIENFAEDHPHGTYIVATGSHVVCIKDGGQILDNWDSSKEVPTYYYTKEQDYGEL
jgi:hypothetical protein